MLDKTAREVFVKKLRNYMVQKGISQADIAAKMNLTASTVSDWYNGKNYPRVDAMQRLAALLNVSMRELTTESDEVIELAPDESVLLSGYRSLSKDGKEYILQTITMAQMAYPKNVSASNVESPA